MKLHATIDKINIDSESESTLILKIPLSDIKNAISLANYTQKLLEVEIHESKEKYYEIQEL